MLTSNWSRQIVTVIAAALVSVPVLAAAIGPATQPAAHSAPALAARVVA